MVVHLTTDHEIEVSNPTTAWAEDNLRIKQVLLPLGLNEADIKPSSILIDSVKKQSIHTQRKYKKKVVDQNKLNLLLENHFYSTNITIKSSLINLIKIGKYEQYK